MSDLPTRKETLQQAVTAQQWLRAVRKADLATGSVSDTAELVRLLRSGLPIGKGPRKLLADLLDRHQLRRKPGRQQLPVYRESLRERGIAAAVRQVKKLTGRGCRVSDAVDAIAPVFGLHEDEHMAAELLENAVRRRRGSARRRSK